MGSSSISRVLLLAIVVQLILMSGAEGSHGNQTWDLIDVGFEMLEMMKNIFELTKNVNKLQKTNEAIRLNGQQLQSANKALSLDVQQLQSANKALTSDVQQLHQTNQVLSSDLQQLKNTTAVTTGTMIQGSQGGGIYTQWGRSICTNNNTEMVYSGYAGGSHYLYAGAAEYVCLPKDPSYNASFTSLIIGGYIYGAEYEQTSGSLTDHDVPCAVCRSRLISIVMIPARDRCYNGWTQQYHGTLASGHYGDASANQYVCLDANPEVRTGGKGNRDGKRFYSVTATCSNLPCPLYQSGKALSCVVCSK